jgi:hypothetical protein
VIDDMMEGYVVPRWAAPAWHGWALYIYSSTAWRTFNLLRVAPS